MQGSCTIEEEEIQMVRQISMRITADPDVCFGKPVIAGTRIPVTIIMGQLAAGQSWDDIAKDYAVTRDDIRAVLMWALKLVEKQTVRVKRASAQQARA
jgi:uncharacterized protein (DUF433 family)